MLPAKPNGDAPEPSPRVHGGLKDAELARLGLDRREVVDFSVNTNPYGPPRRVLEALQRAVLDRYPDPQAAGAVRAAARALEVPVEEVVFGSGAADLLWTLARALLEPTKTALIVEPTFCEFRAAAERTGARVIEWRAEARADFAIDLESVAARVSRERVDVVYLASPNTPTGVACPIEDLSAVAAKAPDTVFVLDQSFLSLSGRALDAARCVPKNVVRVRSLTKDFAIPGVRVGYALAAPELVRRVEAERPAWTTSALAEAAAIACFEEAAFVEESRRRLLADLDFLALRLRESLALRPVPSSTIFLVVPVPDAAALRERLLSRARLHVRDCASFGLPNMLRLAARPRADVERLVCALQEALG